jgi:hypothetical protein
LFLTGIVPLIYDPCHAAKKVSRRPKFGGRTRD